MLVVLSACSTLRLGYQNGPQLAWWWIDGYLDFRGEQVPPAKEAIARWFDWHRETQLVDYAALLGAVRAQASANLSAEAVCRINGELRAKLRPAVDRLLALAADWAPRLSSAQLDRLEQKLAEGNREAREQVAQSDRADRARTALERAVKLAERFYGDLAEAQHRAIAEGVSRSPFDPELWLSEREARQRETLAALRRLVAERATPAQAHAVLLRLADESQRSRSPEQRAYRQRLQDSDCALTAAVHNAAGELQRRRLRERLEGWENDLRALAAPEN